jgi:hypothetical protein
MAKTVMSRVVELISTQKPEIQAYLREVLRIERAHQANAEAGIREKLQIELERQVKELKGRGE